MVLVPVVDIRQSRQWAHMVEKTMTYICLCQKETGVDHSLLP